VASARRTLAGLPSNGLPYRIRAPLAKLQERKKPYEEQFRPPALGDGEQLEGSAATPDYLRLALTSRVYDMVQQSPLQYASGLSHRLNASVHIKREDLLPSFSYRIRGAYNVLDALRRDGTTSVVTYSVGSQGHSLAVAAQSLGIAATIVMPERVPAARVLAIERAGGQVKIHGRQLDDARQEAVRMADESGGSLVMIRPHDDPRAIAGQATVGLEIIRQHGAAIEAAGTGAHLDAIFVCTGGSSLIAGVAAAVKQMMPTTKIIGVEPSDHNLLEQSLLSGHQVRLPEPSHFVDGASVQQLGPEVFRICDELVDDIITVSNDEICAAVRDCFEDTRAMLEPAGAVSVAGLKRWLASRRPAQSGSEVQPSGNYVCISSDAANIEFDLLRFVAERASMGEHKERLFALEIPDRAGFFGSVYAAVQPRQVTEFVYRYSPHHENALVYMCVIQADESLSHEEEVAAVQKALEPMGVDATDVTSNEMAKTHARYLAGGRPGTLPGERLIRVEFPELGSGSLASFLSSLRDDWFVTLLHYRNHGGQVGKVLAGIQVPPGSEEDFATVLREHEYTFFDETNNPIYLKYMR